MRRRVVVTGLGIVCPLGNDVSTVWAACCEGRSGVRRISKFDPSDYRSQMAGEVSQFQVPSIIPHKEVKKMDDFTLYAIEAARQALSDSGLVIDESLQEETGVWLGVGIGGLSGIERCYDILREQGPQRITPFFLPMILANMAAGHISLLFGTKNYNGCSVSACASSNHAIGDAARLIERGDAKVMIVGGSEAAVTPLGVGGFSAMRAMSTRNEDPEKASRPYDQGRDGFVLAEGAGSLILEELEFAQSRGAHIYAELVGYGFSSDSHHITSPSTEGPARSMKNALKDAGLSADKIDYINAHGTSTPVGDINELHAIESILGANTNRVSISSTKSMMGHLLGGAGAVEAVVTMLAMKHHFIHPTINIEQLDPECRLDVTPNHGRSRKVEVAMSNSFGFGGTNATLVFKSI